MSSAFARAVADASSRPSYERIGSDSAFDSEFEAIESCLAASERGRRFLDEYARRRRAEDSLRIVAALDRIEARSLRTEIDRVRERLESERVAEVARQLSDVLKELRPVAEARTRARAMEEAPTRVTALERRFAALVQLDHAAAENGLKLFG